MDIVARAKKDRDLIHMLAGMTPGKQGFSGKKRHKELLEQLILREIEGIEFDKGND